MLKLQAFFAGLTLFTQGVLEKLKTHTPAAVHTATASAVISLEAIKQKIKMGTAINNDELLKLLKAMNEDIGNSLPELTENLSILEKLESLLSYEQMSSKKLITVLKEDIQEEIRLLGKSATSAPSKAVSMAPMTEKEIEDELSAMPPAERAALLKELGLPDEQASATKIQAAFRKYKARKPQQPTSSGLAAILTPETASEGVVTRAQLPAAKIDLSTKNDRELRSIKDGLLAGLNGKDKETFIKNNREMAKALRDVFIEKAKKVKDAISTSEGKKQENLTLLKKKFEDTIRELSTGFEL